MRMHSFSANQKHVIFFFMYIVNMVPWNTPETPLLMLGTKINLVAV